MARDLLSFAATRPSHLLTVATQPTDSTQRHFPGQSWPPALKIDPRETDPRENDPAKMTYVKMTHAK
jgi:hypothetical protein